MLKILVFASGPFQAPHVTRDGVGHYNITEAQGAAFSIAVTPVPPAAAEGEPAIKAKQVRFAGSNGSSHNENIAPYCLAGDGPVLAGVHQPFIVGGPGQPQAAPNLIALPAGRRVYDIDCEYSNGAVESAKVSINVGEANWEPANEGPGAPPADEEPEEPAEPGCKISLVIPTIFTVSRDPRVGGIPLDKVDEFEARILAVYHEMKYTPPAEGDSPAGAGDHEHGDA